MKRVSRLTVLVVCTAYLGTGWSFAQLVSRTSGGTPEPGQRVVLSSQVLSNITHPKPRTLLINSLVADAATRQILDLEARRVARTSSQLATTTLAGKSATALPLDLAPMMQLAGGTPRIALSSALPGYESLNWDAGIEFTPSQPGPLFATSTGAAYRAGAMGVIRGGIHPVGFDLARQLAQDVFVLCSDGLPGSMVKPYVRLALDLPGPGTYLIAAEVCQADGGAAVDLTPVSTVWSWSHASAGRITLTRLSDGSGVVGIATVDPFTTAPGYIDLSQTQMRRVSAVVDFENSSIRPLFFGGFTITRL